MDFFEFDESQKSIIDLANDFTNREILPRSEEFDRTKEFPTEVFQKALEVGLLNLTVPEKFGGAGLGVMELCLVTERMSRGCVGVAGALNLNGMMFDALLMAGTDKQKSKYISQIVKGGVAGYAMTEPEAGSDVMGIQTRAEKKGNDYVLNGSKTWISNATVADLFLVFAKTDPEKGHKGMTAFLVEKGMSGFKIGKTLNKMGQRAFPAAELFFEDLKLSESQMVGKEGEGFKLAMAIFDRSRPMVASLGVGLIERCLELSLEYAKIRKSGGRPLMGHQAVSHKISDMATKLEAAKLLTYKSAKMIDQGTRNTLYASMAKVFSSDAAAWASSEALQIYGGMGYSTEYGLEKLYRDAKVLQIYEGTSEIQRNIIARELSQ